MVSPEVFTGQPGGAPEAHEVSKLGLVKSCAEAVAVMSDPMRSASRYFMIVGCFAEEDDEMDGAALSSQMPAARR